MSKQGTHNTTEPTADQSEIQVMRVIVASSRGEESLEEKGV